MRTLSILSDEHLQAIGLVTAEWSEMEFYLHATIWAIANIENPGRGNAMTDHLRAQSLSNVLESVAYDRYGDSPTFKLVRILAKDIRRLYEERNKFAHGKWQKDNIDQLVYRMNRRSQKRLAASWEAIGVSDITDIAAQIADLTDRLDALFFEHKPESWPDEPRRPGLQ